MIACSSQGRRRRQPVELPDPPTHSPDGRCLTCHDTGQMVVEFMPGVVAYLIACPICHGPDL